MSSEAPGGHPLNAIDTQLEIPTPLDGRAVVRCRLHPDVLAYYTAKGNLSAVRLLIGSALVASAADALPGPAKRIARAAANRLKVLAVAIVAAATEGGGQAP